MKTYTTEELEEIRLEAIQMEEAQVQADLIDEGVFAKYDELGSWELVVNRFVELRNEAKGNERDYQHFLCCEGRASEFLPSSGSRFTDCESRGTLADLYF